MLNWFKNYLSGLLTVFILISSQAAMAQTGEWHVEEGGRIRISYDTKPRRGVEAGEVHGVIEVELNPGWKTYWKNPGSSGMAPKLQFFYHADDEERLKPLDFQFLFPAPKLFEGVGEEFINGYQDYVSLPFSVTFPEKVDEIVGHLSIGLCKDVCLPVSMDFSIDLHGRADFATKARIELAREALPKRAMRSFEVDYIKIFRLEATRKVWVIHLELQTPAETPESALPQLFIHADNVQFSKLKLITRVDNDFLYQTRVVSGEPELVNRLDYTATLGSRAVSGSLSLDESKWR